jgi:hypothetical protein
MSGTVTWAQATSKSASARARAQAFVAGVPAENRWMYDAAELYHGMFAKHDSGYPPPPEHEQEEQAAAGTAGSARL